MILRARHVEVQILGDKHGNMYHLFERDCSVQRRNQKVVERAPAPYLSDAQREDLCKLGYRICKHVNYECAGTVEFLMDMDTGDFYFIEVNPRVQVEHTVTEEVTGIDIVQAQIRIAEGSTLLEATGKASQVEITLNGHALQTRITTEDPLNNFIPDYGRITAYRSATGMGIRLDGGTAYSGGVITRYYDSLLTKVTAWAPTPEAAIARMDRALREFRIRGVSTNINFVENLLKHPTFLNNEYTTKFIDSTPELFKFSKRRDRGTKVLTYIADITVNGHPETTGRAKPADLKLPRPPAPVAEPGRRQPHPARREGAQGRRRLDAGAGEAAADRHHDARRAPVAAGHPDAVDRHGARGPGLCRQPARALQRGMLGGRHLRRRLPVPAGMPVAAPARPARRDAQPADADAAAGLQRGGLHQLPRQRGARIRAAGRRDRRRRVPRLRQPQLGAEHARGDGRGGRERQDLRGHDLLYRRHPRPGPRQVRPEILCRHGARVAGCRRACARAQGHGGAPQARLGQRPRQGAQGRARHPRAFSHPRHLRDRRRVDPRRGRGRRRRGRRGDGFLLGRHLAALPRLDRHGAPEHPARHRPADRAHPRAVALLGGGPRAIRGLRGRDPGAGLGGLPARDAGRAVHQPQGAGAQPRARGSLARDRPHLRGCEPDVRRHREGHAELQGRGRHGADDGEPGAHPRRGRGPRTRMWRFPIR